MALTFPTSTPSARRVAAFVAFVAVAMSGGLLAGEWLKRAFEAPTTARVVNRGSLLADGQRLPTVALRAADGGETTTSRLFSDRGGAIIFLSADCEACPAMVRQWTEAIDTGKVDGLRIVGVTNDKHAVMADFIREHGVRFPVYRDREQTFSIVYEVTGHPYELVIDDDRRVRRRRNDVNEPLDAAAVSALVSG